MNRAQLHYNDAETFAFFEAIRDAFPAELFLNRRGNAGEGFPVAMTIDAPNA